LLKKITKWLQLNFSKKGFKTIALDEEFNKPILATEIDQNI